MAIYCRGTHPYVSLEHCVLLRNNNNNNNNNNGELTSGVELNRRTDAYWLFDVDREAES